MTFCNGIWKHVFHQHLSSGQRLSSVGRTCTGRGPMCENHSAQDLVPFGAKAVGMFCGTPPTKNRKSTLPSGPPVKHYMRIETRGPAKTVVLTLVSLENHPKGTVKRHTLTHTPSHILGLVKKTNHAKVERALASGWCDLPSCPLFLEAFTRLTQKKFLSFSREYFGALPSRRRWTFKSMLGIPSHELKQLTDCPFKSESFVYTQSAIFLESFSIRACGCVFSRVPFLW